MAENGNRGPNDFRARNGKKRREPPLIDASATEVPVDPADPAVVQDDVAASPAGGEPERRDVAETAEPVLFGSAVREAGAKPDGVGISGGSPADAEAAPGFPASSVDAATTDSMHEAAATPEEAPVVSPARAPAGADRVASAAPPATSGGVLPWLLSLCILALLGALSWLLYTEPQRSGRDALADLRAKVAALEARPDPSSVQGSVAALDKRVGVADAERSTLARTVAGLTTRLDAVAQSARADADKSTAAPAPSGAAAVATVGALAAIAAKVDAVDGRVAALAADQGRSAKAIADLPKPVAPDFGPVNAKVAAVDAQANAIDGKVAAIDGKVNGSDARLNAFDAKVNGVDGKINGFDARMNGLENRLNGIDAKSAGTGTDLVRLQAAVAGLPRIDLAPLQASATALDGKVARIEGQLSAAKDGARVTEARAVGSADEARAAPIALVGQAVARAIADGRPYASDLDALKALGVESEPLAKLSPLAAKGAPTAAALRDRWEKVRGDVLAAVKPAEAGSALDRFAANARALVQVRRTGAVQGDDAAALVSQVDAALNSGDVSGALAAWTRLPPAGQDRSQDWAAAAKARAEAAGAAQAIVGRAIATLGRTKS